ncbi:hypothetical protein L9F63_021788, partial [Diploptera punctata]
FLFFFMDASDIPGCISYNIIVPFSFNHISLLWVVIFQFLLDFFVLRLESSFEVSHNPLCNVMNVGDEALSILNNISIFSIT